ncbi:glycosyltransferase [Pseudobythopirellula maris]|uniref:glycosyltransferase n=1 Tax=Pseudobythopirellula maris TaxID=2527991 RepID=UPI0018D460AA|nr:glycosyltransferase [Pseudobythopirellula maris]
MSETFLLAHAEQLPGVTTVVHHVGRAPAENGKPWISQAVGPRAWRKLGRMFTGRPWSWEVTSGLLNAFRHRRPDVVLAEYGINGVAVLEACRIAKLPLVVHFHGYDASAHKVIEKYGAEYTRMFSEAAAIVAVSQAMRRALIDLGCPDEKIVVSPCGVDCEQFRQADPGDAGEIFLSVGRLVDKKSPHLLLLSFSQVLRARPQAKLRVVGDGPLRGVCDDLVVGLRMAHAVELLGAQSHEVVVREMATARAFVQHSVTAASGDSEGMPVAVLEANACGLPVVATRHAGIPDVVIEGETGLLVDERDTEGMAREMLRLASDPQLARTIGGQARRRVIDRYTMRHSIERLSRVLSAAANHEPIHPVKWAIDTELAVTTAESREAV